MCEGSRGESATVNGILFGDTYIINGICDFFNILLTKKQLYDMI